jgi:hypothetical protein
MTELQWTASLLTLVSVLHPFFGAFAHTDFYVATPGIVEKDRQANRETGPAGRPDKSANAASGRDLSLYEKAGPYESDPWPVNGDCSHTRSEAPAARDFIFRHWESKRRAYVVIKVLKFEFTSGASPEVGFERRIAHIFVEPNANGVWHVVCVTVRADGVIDERREFTHVERTRGETEICQMDAIEVVYKLKFTGHDSDETWYL